MHGLTRTAAGDLRGVEEAGLWIFRGVPYAADPSRHRRWRRPEPPSSWSGVRESAHFGPIAPQPPPVPGMSIRGDPTDSAEDCLSLNVWTPGLDDARRPVLVWIHGGGFTSGSGSSLLYRGERLALMGDVVVVTINYRLGALGFLAHPRLAEPEGGWGNWGLLDQIAALDWVRENIAEFGGDPDNVTVFGESAGAMSISALLASSAATRLFHKAIIQSGPPTCGSSAWGQRRTAKFLAKLAESGHSIAGPDASPDRYLLEGVPPEKLVTAAQRLEPEGEGLPLAFMPVVDDGVVTGRPADVIRKGNERRIPLIIGTNRDECTFFVLGDQRAAGMDEVLLARRVAAISSAELAGPLVSVYRRARSERGEEAGPLAIWTAITTDLVFRLPSLSFAEALADKGAQVFAYLFTWTSPFLGGILGSAHALEIPFVFGSVAHRAVQPYSGSGPAAIALSDAMIRSWSAFASSGDPSCDELGQWHEYDAVQRHTMVLGEHSAVEQDPRGEEREAWSNTGVDMANRLYQH
ncbi:MAG: carboxylesterase/lipase family protein [Acidimicrobiales bacterium]